MDKASIIQQTESYVKQKLIGEGSGHDWWHVFRVLNNALLISKGEKADLFIVQLASLLHDISDWKFNNGDDSVGPKVAREWLNRLGVSEDVISQVCSIIKDLSFKGAGVKSEMKSIEGMVVQDADRLDALGAIGVARAFAYGGSKGREIYNPDVKPELHNSFEAYKKNNSNSINHFYEKLLLLKDLMNTKTAKKIAETRHNYMEEFLDEFYKEWEGEK